MEPVLIAIFRLETGTLALVLLVLWDIGNACAVRHKILVEKNVLCIACRRYAISS